MTTFCMLGICIALYVGFELNDRAIEKERKSFENEEF